MYSVNIVVGLLEELLELKESIKHQSKAGKVLDVISIQIS